MNTFTLLPATQRTNLSLNGRIHWVDIERLAWSARCDSHRSTASKPNAGTSRGSLIVSTQFAALSVDLLQSRPGSFSERTQIIQWIYQIYSKWFNVNYQHYWNSCRNRCRY